MVKKIALVDIDNCLISNKTSDYNEELIKHLLQQKFNGIYLVTGRTSSDIHLHVLQGGNPSGDWQGQLLTKIPDNLKKLDLQINGITTPHDVVRQNPDGSIIENNGVHVALTDESCKYLQLEKKLLSLQKNDISNIVKVSREERFDESDIVTHLVIKNDTEKRGQILNLLDNLELRVEEEDCEFEIFDDKRENLESIARVLKDKGFKSVKSRHVDFSEGRQVSHVAAAASRSIPDNQAIPLGWETFSSNKGIEFS